MSTSARRKPIEPPARKQKAAPENPPPDVAKRELAKNLTAQMARKGWNQSDLARQATLHMPGDKKVTRDSVARYCRAGTMPGHAAIRAMAAALGVEPAELLPWKVTPTAEQRVPSFEMRDAGNNTSWLRVNQAVPTATALKIMALLNEEKG